MRAGLLILFSKAKVPRPTSLNLVSLTLAYLPLAISKKRSAAPLPDRHAYLKGLN